jgi:deoxycytidylate deaminase
MKPKHCDVAVKMAQKSDYKFRVGCVIVRGSKIVSFGWNDGVKTHTKSNHPFKSLHAEADAIISARREDLSGCSAYVARLRKDGSIAIAKPCQFCEAMLRKVGIKQVFYTTDDGWVSETYV